MKINKLTDVKELEKLLASGIASRERSLQRYHKEHYNFARELGFTSKESGVMQNWSKERINILAQKRFNRVDYIQTPEE